MQFRGVRKDGPSAAHRISPENAQSGRKGNDSYSTAGAVAGAAKRCCPLL
jgi:hypothetical protein